MESFKENKTLLQLLSFAVCYFLAIGTYRLVFHPLARFPGPRLAALTRLYEGFYDIVQNGQYTFRIGRLHEIYGESIPETKGSKWLTGFNQQVPL